MRERALQLLAAGDPIARRAGLVAVGLMAGFVVGVTVPVVFEELLVGLVQSPSLFAARPL